MKCGMTLVIPMTSLCSFTMEDQCLDEDETLLSEEWETPSEELSFLCSDPGEEDIYQVKERGIKRKGSCNVFGGESSPLSLVDQRRLILQVTFEKLRRLEDPESCLRRTVLINNTFKMLHRQIYSEENPYICSGVVTLKPAAAKDESSPSGAKVIRLSFDNTTVAIADDSRNKLIDSGSSLTSGENFCDSCALSEAFNEDLEDDVFDSSGGVSCDRESIFGELDNVFHSFICALET